MHIKNSLELALISSDTSHRYWFILILWMRLRNLWYHVKFCIFIKSHHLAQTPIPTVCSSECRFPSLTLFKMFQNILESVQTALKPNSVLCQRWLGAPDRSWVTYLIWFYLSDPMEWNCGNVQKWLLWTEHLYRLPQVGKAFQDLDGKDLCSMSEEDFRQRSPQCSETLHAHLDIWKSGEIFWSVCVS